MSGPGIDVAKLKARLMEQRDALRDVADSTKEAAQPVELDQTRVGRVSRMDAMQAQAMAKEYGPDGIHVGHVVVDGPIGGEKIKKGFPEYAEKLGNEGMIDIQGIVDGYEYLHNQPRNAWTFELDVRTSVERW